MGGRPSGCTCSTRDQGQALRKIAETVVTQALAGNKDAWKEIGDRLDGRAVQPIAGDVDLNLTVEIAKFAGKAA